MGDFDTPSWHTFRVVSNVFFFVLFVAIQGVSTRLTAVACPDQCHVNNNSTYEPEKCQDISDRNDREEGREELFTEGACETKIWDSILSGRLLAWFVILLWTWRKMWTCATSKTDGGGQRLEFRQWLFVWRHVPALNTDAETGDELYSNTETIKMIAFLHAKTNLYFYIAIPMCALGCWLRQGRMKVCVPINVITRRGLEYRCDTVPRPYSFTTLSDATYTVYAVVAVFTLWYGCYLACEWCCCPTENMRAAQPPWVKWEHDGLSCAAPGGRQSGDAIVNPTYTGEDAAIDAAPMQVAGIHSI
eukprot:m.253939 g.253939  ORF g.253939 m.253939 type:complete len:303 (+) comp26533_c0_seq1:126-1034(+)